MTARWPSLKVATKISCSGGLEKVRNLWTDTKRTTENETGVATGRKCGELRRNCQWALEGTWRSSAPDSRSRRGHHKAWARGRAWYVRTSQGLLKRTSGNRFITFKSYPWCKQEIERLFRNLKNWPMNIRIGRGSSKNGWPDFESFVGICPTWFLYSFLQ